MPREWPSGRRCPRRCPRRERRHRVSSPSPGGVSVAGARNGGPPAPSPAPGPSRPPTRSPRPPPRRPPRLVGRGRQGLRRTGGAAVRAMLHREDLQGVGKSHAPVMLFYKLPCLQKQLVHRSMDQGDSLILLEADELVEPREVLICRELFFLKLCLQHSKRLVKTDLDHS